jgi:hypothetical protein
MGSQAAGFRADFGRWRPRPGPHIWQATAVEDIAASMGTLLLPCNTMSRSQAPDNRGEMWLGAGLPPNYPS